MKAINQQKIKELAKEMGLEVLEANHDNQAKLKLNNNFNLFFYHDWRGKTEVSIYPNKEICEILENKQVNSIGISLDRDTKALAKDIKRRLTDDKFNLEAMVLRLNAYHRKSAEIDGRKAIHKKLEKLGFTTPKNGEYGECKIYKNYCNEIKINGALDRVTIEIDRPGILENINQILDFFNKYKGV